jgi:hypothetical protein
MRNVPILVAATLLLAGQAVAAPLSVVGFNIESGDSSDHVIALQLDKSVGVDIWGLSDVWDDGDWLERLQRGATSGEGSDFGLLLGETGGTSRLLAIYRQTRLRYLGHEEVDSAQASRREPAPLAVRFLLDGETEFLFLIVHLSESDKRRAGQVEAIVKWTAGQTLPVVSVGTFNFGLDTDGGGGQGELGELATAGWQWVRPETPLGTYCGGRDVVQDFVFVAGAASDWGARSDVMFPQNNYCPDDERTSDHRPILANLDTRGGAPVVTGSMTARAIRPFFPDTLIAESDAQIELANEPQPVPAVTVDPRAQMPGAAPGQPAPAPDRVAEMPRTAVVERPGKAELLRRLERLEAEVRSLRREIEATSE